LKDPKDQVIREKPPYGVHSYFLQFL